MVRFTLVLAVSAAVLSPVAALADDWKACQETRDDHKQTVAICSRVIQAGKLSKRDLSNAYLRRAHAAGLSGDKAARARDHDKAIEIDPTNHDAFRARAFIAYLDSDYKRAVIDYTKAIELKPETDAHWTGRAEAYGYLGETDRAIADYTKAIEVDTGNPALWYSRRGRLYEKKGDLERALADYRIALKRGTVDSKTAEDLKNLEAKMAANKGSAPAKSADSAQPAGKRAPNITEDKANCAPLTGAKLAIEACTRVIESKTVTDPRMLSHYYRTRAHARNRESDKPGRDRDFELAVQTDPSNVVAYEDRANVRAAESDWKGALDDFDHAIRLSPQPAYLFARAEIWIHLGQTGRAITDYTAALGKELSPVEMSATYAARGMLYEKGGDHIRARDDYRAAIKAGNTDQTVRNRLASLEAELAKSGSQELAERSAPREPAKEGEQLRSEPSKVEPKLALRDEKLESPKPPLRQGKRVALVIGNGKYQHSSVLHNPGNDAADMAALLRGLGFDVVEGRDLDRRGLDDVVRQFSRRVERAEVALFFYAGHGLQVDGKNYLVPVDAKLERPADLNFDALDINTVLAVMEQESTVNLVFLDACRDNPLARTLSRSFGTRSGAVGQGLSAIQSGAGTLISFATQPGNVAFDGEQGTRNSPFTSALLKHLPTRGLDISGVMRRVRSEVYEATRRKQLPWDHSALMGTSDIVLAQ